MVKKLFWINFPEGCLSLSTGAKYTMINKGKKGRKGSKASVSESDIYHGCARNAESNSKVRMINYWSVSKCMIIKE